MITTVPITSLNHPDLTPYRTLRQSVEQFRKGMFIAEGTIVVQRLLESVHKIVSVLITPEWLEDYREQLSSRPEQITVYVGKKELLNTIVGYNLHQSIMALGKIPAQETIDSVLTQSPSPRLFVAMDGLANAENIGVLVRNCTAFGVQALFVGETSSSPYLRRAVRNSMGTIFKMPVVHCAKLVEMLTTLQRSHQFKIFAAHPHTEEHRFFRQLLSCVWKRRQWSFTAGSFRMRHAGSNSHAVRCRFAQCSKCKRSVSLWSTSAANRFGEGDSSPRTLIKLLVRTAVTCVLSPPIGNCTRGGCHHKMVCLYFDRIGTRRYKGGLQDHIYCRLCRTTQTHLRREYCRYSSP